MKNTIIHFGLHEKRFSGGSVFFVFGQRLQEKSFLSFEGEFFTSEISDKFSGKFQNVAACILFDGTILDAQIEDSPLLHADFTSLDDEFIQKSGLFPNCLSMFEMGMYLGFLEDKGLNSSRDSICCHNRVGYSKNIIFDIPTTDNYNVSSLMHYCEIGNFSLIKRHVFWAIKKLTFKIQYIEGDFAIEQLICNDSECKVIDFKEVYSEFEKMRTHCNGDFFITTQELSIIMQDTGEEILDTQYVSVPTSLRIKFATLELPSYKRLFDSLGLEIASYISK